MDRGSSTLVDQRQSEPGKAAGNGEGDFTAKILTSKISATRVSLRKSKGSRGLTITTSNVYGFSTYINLC